MKEFKHSYDVTFILQGKGNYGAPVASRFLEIDHWLKDSFDYRLKWKDLGQHGYWELLVDEEEYFTAFKLVWGW
jgi:hypothetical protein